MATDGIKIKDAHDANPTAADDLSKEWAIPLDDGSNSTVAGSISQAANLIANRLGISNNPSLQGTFSATVQANQTIASYTSNFTDVPVRHFVTITGQVPTLPSDGKVGPMDGVFDLVDFNNKSFEGFTWDGSVWSKRLSAIDNGTGGFDIKAKDTIPPTEVNDIQYTNITQTSASVNWTDSTDSGSGILRQDLWSFDDDIVEQSGVTSPITISNKVPGQSYSYGILTLDKASPPNSTITQEAAIVTMLQTAAGTVWMAPIVAVTEGGNQSFSIIRINGSTGPVSFKFNTPNHAQNTAKDGINYRGRGLNTVTGNVTRVNATTANVLLVDHGAQTNDYVEMLGANEASYNGAAQITRVDADNFQYTFFAGDPGGNATGVITAHTGHIIMADGISGTSILVETINAASPENNRYQGELTPGSETGGVSIGSPNAVFADITATGSSTTTYLQSLVGSDYIAVIDAVNYDNLTDDGLRIWNVITSLPDGSIPDVIEVTPSAQATTQSTISGNTSRAQYKIRIDPAAAGQDHYIWLRGNGESTARNTSFAGVDGTDSLLPSNPNVAHNPAFTYVWAQAKSGGESLINLTAGDHTLEVYHREAGDSISQVLIVNANAATYTPSGVLTESATASGAPLDNPNNPITVIPPGSSTVSAFINSIPATGSTNIQFGASILITYPGSGLAVNSNGITITYNGGVDSVTVGSIAVDSGSNSVNITPATALPIGNTLYTVQIGTPLTSGGTTVVNGVTNSLANETITFTTIDVASPSVLLSVDFSQVSPGTVLLQAEFESLFNNSNGVVAGASNTMYRGNFKAVSDPSGNSARGNVLEIGQLAGVYGTGHTVDGSPKKDSGGQFFWDTNSRVQESYCAFDFYIDPSYQDHKSQKLMGFRGRKGVPNPANPGGHGDEKMLAYMVWTSTRGVYGLQGYFSIVDLPGVPKAAWCTLANPGQNNISEQYYLPKGIWVTIEMHVKNNSAIGVKDGELDIWVNDPRTPANGGTNGLHQLMYTTSNKWFSRDPDNLKWDPFFFVSWLGGNDSTYFMPVDQNWYTDNIGVSSSRIYS